VRGLYKPFDRNNAGVAEPDNLGQALYMISLVSDRSHPLVETVLRELPKFRTGRHMVGSTDGAEHPVYQTKWLKFGLRALGLDDAYEPPQVFDAYSALFWMDYRDRHVPGRRFGAESAALYPYLAWAEAHFHREAPPAFDEADHPLTWEGRGSEAEYQRMAVVSARHVAERQCTPHTWHAAEMFLYFADGNLPLAPR